MREQVIAQKVGNRSGMGKSTALERLQRNGRRDVRVTANHLSPACERCRLCAGVFETRRWRLLSAF